MLIVAVAKCDSLLSEMNDESEEDGLSLVSGWSGQGQYHLSCRDYIKLSAPGLKAKQILSKGIMKVHIVMETAKLLYVGF